MSNVASTLLPFSATMSNEISSFRQSRNKLCSICFDFVKRTKFYNRIVRYCCCLWQQSRMLLRQCCLLIRSCCRHGRGLTKRQKWRFFSTNSTWRYTENQRRFVALVRACFMDVAYWNSMCIREILLQWWLDRNILGGLSINSVLVAANCPPQILSCFKISSTKSLALQCSKKLTKPITLTAYSPLLKSTGWSKNWHNIFCRPYALTLPTLLCFLLLFLRHLTFYQVV